MINEKANRIQDNANEIIDIKSYVDDLIIESKKLNEGFSTNQIANIVKSVYGNKGYNIAFEYILNKRGLSRFVDSRF
mgnify:CR=1 FL=1|tara:strand:- start:1713 stop:1943 length:231 start_codon:yes stop_codon:yes gene_type:complete